MPRARKLCADPTCGRAQPCPDHTRAPFASSVRPGPRARGYTAEYDRLRIVVLREEHDCGICHRPGRQDDQVDHVVALKDGGTNERSNLQRAHRDCNLAKGQQR